LDAYGPDLSLDARLNASQHSAAGKMAYTGGWSAVVVFTSVFAYGVLASLSGFGIIDAW